MSDACRAALWRRFAALLAVALCAPLASHAQQAIVGVDVRSRANGMLTLMGYAVAPDVTTSSLSVSDRQTLDPALSLTQFGAGATFDRRVPLYLEGNVAIAAYEPTFQADVQGSRRDVAARWDAASASAGIGWDFAVAPHWVLRPIFNVSLGYVASEAAVEPPAGLADDEARDLRFVRRGRLNAHGLGGALMLDFERLSPEHDIDFEARCNIMALRSRGNSSQAVEGESTAASVSLYGRWRAPTGWVVLQRPLRYVAEAATSHFLGSDSDALGIDRMHSVGVGLELDTSAHDVGVTRTRVLARYKFGSQVEGWSFGVAMSF